MTREEEPKSIDAWMIVNKDFEMMVSGHPNHYSAEVFFTPSQAIESLEKRFPKLCVCGHKNKKEERHIKVIKVTINL